MQKYIKHIIFHNSHQYPCHGPTYTFSAKRHTLYGHTVLPALIYQEICTVTVSSVSLIHYTGTVECRFLHLEDFQVSIHSFHFEMRIQKVRRLKRQCNEIFEHLFLLKIFDLDPKWTVSRTFSFREDKKASKISWNGPLNLASINLLYCLFKCEVHLFFLINLFLPFILDFFVIFLHPSLSFACFIPSWQWSDSLYSKCIKLIKKSVGDSRGVNIIWLYQYKYTNYSTVRVVNTYSIFCPLEV